MRSLRAAGLRLLLLALPLACGGEAVPRDVVVLMIDTLRADHVGAYGYARDTTPHIDALAAEGVVFERAYAAAPWTLPSVVSLMTSTFPCEHGVVVDGQQLALRLVPLAERLRANGYATANFHANAYAGSISGLDRGFQVSEARDYTDGERVGRWLDTLGSEQPFFLYVHNIEPHTPYKAPAGEVERFAPVSAMTRDRVNGLLGRFQALGRTDWSGGRPPGTTDVGPEQAEVLAELAGLRDEIVALYDADVRHADARIGSVLDALRSRGRLARAIVVLLSDHGEEFLEHGYWQHDQSLYEELVRVPLVLRVPGAPGGRRVATPVALVDVVPTLAELLDRPSLAEGARGRSLVPLARGAGGEDPGARVVAERFNRKKYFAPHARERGDRNLAIVDGDWKAIWNADPETLELYGLPEDGLEQRSRSAEEEERAARYASAAAEWWADCRLVPPRAGAETDEATRQRLRALGYVE